MASTLEEPQAARLLTVAEVAERLRLSVWSVYRMVEREELPAIRLGSGRMAPVRVDEQELEAWLRGEPC
jgi:excisionase family DNA binding protein